MRTPTVAALALIVTAALTASPVAADNEPCEFLVAPSGGAFEVPTHRNYLTALQFPDKLGAANTSDAGDYEIRRDGDTDMLVRPRKDTAARANITVTTGTIKISVVLRTVTDSKDACTFVNFKVTTEEEVRKRAIEEAVAARTAELKAQLDALKRDTAATVRAQLDGAIADRAVARLDITKLAAVDRNDAGVVVWVLRAGYLGRDVLVNVEIENRSSSTARIADMELRAGAKNLATAARLAGGAGVGAIGSVAPGAKVRGVVFLRDFAAAGKDLRLVVRLVDGEAVTVGGLGLR